MALAATEKSLDELYAERARTERLLSKLNAQIAVKEREERREYLAAIQSGGQPAISPDWEEACRPTG